ncbi:hypothetical protein SISNIDRAFT_493788 [Sistotremastrum niveocremeum HHB9708]|uniref:Uncharacterized protein n=2 Tax=Sistotremastraceae TaxID=3402574 RepID=A0A164YKP5_9AGAM|nr:hypothetical protein SISNIDRAFT_493788 [Sistotremastrum niveocremeum HHB9708]KZT43429.1 hypothetical protein SISSUDRAFT_1116467 [Sistotremastrum suecicum HHB10207 ss-3]
MAESVICIEYTGDDETSEDVGIPAVSYLPDIPEGPILRLAAYRQAWNKCLSRIKELLEQIQGAAADECISYVEDAYKNINPLIPFKELPTVQLSGLDSSLLNNCLEEVVNRVDALIVCLSISECSSLTTLMKTIIHGITSNPKAPQKDNPKRKAHATLAPYDPGILKAWWTAIKNDLGSPNLVVVFPHIESMDSAIFAEALHILNSIVDDVPLTCIITSATKKALQSIIPWSSLRLLRNHRIDVPCGLPLVETIISKTFLDVDFEPDIGMYGDSIRRVLEWCTRCTLSIDALISYIQIMHLYHFSNPVSLLTVPHLLLPTVYQKSPFIDAIDAMENRLPDNITTEISESPYLPESSTPVVLVQMRKLVRDRALRFRHRLALAHLLQHFLRGVASKHPDLEGGLADLVTPLRRKHVIKYLCLIIKKLSMSQITDLCSKIHGTFQGLSTEPNAPGADLGAQAVHWQAVLADGQTDEQLREFASQMGDWISGYMSEGFQEPKPGSLDLIWHFTSRDVTEELLNPAPHATVVSGLLATSGAESNGNVQTPTGALPDAAILFERYMESGRMINVYDWFQSFSGTLDAEREAKEAKNERQVAQKTDAEWNEEVQGRFLRAMHELDFLGFLKQTGRKADHVMRTAFDTNLYSN